MRQRIPRALQLHTYLGVTYLITNFTRKPMQDKRLREVIAGTQLTDAGDRQDLQRRCRVIVSGVFSHAPAPMPR